MRKQNLKVFDDFVYATAIDQVWTDASLNDALGRFDQLSLIAVADSVSASTTLFVQIEHSADGRNWTTKNASPEIFASIAAGSTITVAGADGGSLPSAGLVRLSVWLSSAVSAHVKIYACQRDQS